MGIIATAARSLARACERSALLTRALRRARFAGRERVIAEIRSVPGPREVEALCDGIRFRLDLEDDVQRGIYFGGYEAREAALIGSLVRPGAVCLDIGANVGFYALQMARAAGDRGVVHAFEPDPRNAERLRVNCSLNPFGASIRVVEAAVADHEGRAVLHQSSESHSGWGSLARFADIAAGSVEVPCVTLDGFLARESIGSVDVLKADVEAGELELLAGARTSLEGKRISLIFIEWNGIRMAERGRTFAEFLAVFERAGYRPGRLNRSLLERMRNGTVRPESLWANFLFEA